MKIESLEYFLEVLKAESITKAANNVFISQQGLSKAIQSLEKEFNVDLLRRSDSGRTIPTEAGQELAVAAQQILNVLDTAKRQMANYNTDGTSVIEMEPINVYLTTYLANTLGFVLNRHEFEGSFAGRAVVMEKNFGKICKSLHESPANTVAIVNMATSLIDNMPREGFLFDPLITANLLIRCAPGLTIAKKKELTKEEVLDLPMALYYEPMLNTVLNEVFKEEEMNVQICTTNRAEINREVVSGELVTFTDSFAQSSLNIARETGISKRDYICIPIEENPQFVIGFLSVKDAERSPSCIRYETVCRNYINLKYAHYLKRYPVNALLSGATL